MMIQWRGKNCSDGCPFFSMTRYASGEPEIPHCGVSGHKDVGTGKIFDIRLEIQGEWADAYCPKGDGCPFSSINLGLPLEVHNDA